MALTRLNSTRDFFRIWFTWKRQALLIFVLIVGVVMMYSYASTPYYKSTAKILLLPKTSEGEIISAGTDETRIAPVSIEDLNTEIELLTSSAVIKDAVSSFGKGGVGIKTQEKAWPQKVMIFIKKTINDILVFIDFKERLSPFDANVAKLRNSLHVEPVARSNIVIVDLKAESPKSAAVVLNRLLETYIRHHNEVFTKEEGVQFFHDQSNDYRIKLEAAEKKFKEFQNEWNIVDLKRQNEANIQFLASIRQELSQVEISRDEAESRIAMLRKGLAKSKRDVPITKEMRTIPSIVELEKAIVPLLIKRSEILKRFTPSSREYKDIQNQIEGLRGDMRNEVMKAIKTDELELESLGIRKKSLQGKISILQKEANQLSQNERVLNDLEREVEMLKANYILYASKAEDARIYSERKNRDLANVSIADNATIPTKPAFPKKFLMALISIIVGLFAALGTPFLLEFFDHRIKTPYEAEELLSLPVICSFREMKT